MPVMQYSVFPPGFPVTADSEIGLAGFHSAPTGHLIKPPIHAPFQLLVFDDRIPFPTGGSQTLTEELDRTAQHYEVQLIWADFERSVNHEAVSLLKNLHHRGYRLLIPAAWTDLAPGEPVICWQPSDGPFAAWLQDQCRRHPHCWLDHMPVHRRLTVSVSGVQETPLPPSVLSDWLNGHQSAILHQDALVCQYAAQRHEETLEVCLWDTEDTFRLRASLADHSPVQGILMLSPEIEPLTQIQKTPSPFGNGV